MFKKILSIAALSISALLLILSVVDVFADKVMLLELLPLKLVVVLMLLITVAVTMVACFDGSWRRPLLLLACLLQTPVAGAMAVVWLYGLCFPEAMPMQALFPFLVALTALASVIQTVVMIVGEGMYEPMDEMAEGEEDEDAAYWDELADLEMDRSSVRPAAGKAAPRQARPAVATMEDDEDDLAPVSKKRRSAPADYPTAMQKPTPTYAQTEPRKYTDPFALLEEENQLEQRKNSAKVSSNTSKDGE
jgi:hypothetical protein